MSNKRQLSSDATFLMKLVFPFIFIGALLTACIALLVSGQYGGALAALAALLIFGTLIWIGLVKLQKVNIDDEHIYISNFFRTDKIPLNNLQAVTGTWLLNYHPIWLHFNTPTEFGNSVMFMPRTNSTAMFSTHPMTKELQTLIEEQKMKAGNKR
jgi:hypothetical protein